MSGVMAVCEAWHHSLSWGALWRSRLGLAPPPGGTSSSSEVSRGPQDPQIIWILWPRPLPGSRTANTATQGSSLPLRDLLLAWEIPWREEAVWLQYTESQRVGHDLAIKQQQPYKETEAPRGCPKIHRLAAPEGRDLIKSLMDPQRPGPEGLQDQLMSRRCVTLGR
ncbi:hypothetical protein CapIbe_022296 [Capra ibex]